MKRERSWKSHPSKSNLAVCHCWPLPIQNSISGASEVQLMQTQLFWIPYSKIYKRSKFQPKTISYEGDMIFQRWQLNSASKQIAWRNESKFHLEASKLTYKCFQHFSSSIKYSRRSRKAATNLKPASSQQPAAFTLPPSIHVHTWTLIFLLTICV